MFKRMKLKTKISIGSLFISLIIMTSLGLVTYFICTDFIETSSIENLTNIIAGVSDLVKNNYEIVFEREKHNLEIANGFFKEKTRLDETKLIMYEIENQVTSEKSRVEIPQMYVDGNLISNSYNLVDKITQLLGGTVTIFQFIPQGLLRISTSVRKKDGSRAVGTYIPIDSPVYHSIIKGETYIGRAFVVTDWYLSGYMPLYENQKMIGVIYVGQKLTDLEALRHSILNKKICSSGFLQVFDSNGLQILHPEKAMEGKIRDDDEYKIMKSKKTGIIKDLQSFSTLNDSIEKIYIFKYVEEMDWIVSGIVPKAEIFYPLERLRNVLFIIFIIIIILVIIISRVFANSIIKPIEISIEILSESSKQVNSGSREIAISSQHLAEASSEQASSLEEASTAIEEITSMTEKNAENANEANNIMEFTSQTAIRANSSMSILKKAMDDMNSFSERTVKIIRVIDEIAFQTNLLALNASVEAARAGEEGMGFAVVADEVRNLALRSAEAAKNTTTLIESSIKNIKDGYSFTKATEKEFIAVNETLIRAKELVNEITIASKEQANGLKQINSAIAEMDIMVQKNASSSEESAFASKEMSSQAQSLMVVVDRLISIVGQKKNIQN